MSSMMYNHAGIEAHAADIKAHATTFNHLLEQLDADLTKLEASWEGSGSASYKELRTKWDQAAASLNVTLGKVGEMVGLGNDDMGATDTAVARSFG